MYHLKRNVQFLILFVVALCICGQAQAKPKYQFKVASIAPEGSVWTKRFRDFAAEVTQQSNGDIGFKIYSGGIMGDDRAVYRKVRVGQLDGGGFTLGGIGSVVPDFRIMGLPFLFRSYDEVDYVREGLIPLFNKAFSDQELELIAMTEVGFVYSMSTTPVATLSDLKKSKVWAPENDPISAAFLRTLGITPLPLTIPDVLTSLQTGMVETVFNSLYGNIVLQWFTKTKYISDIPFGYAYGAMLLDGKKFAHLPDSYQKMIKKTAKKHFDLLIADTRKSNGESRQVLKDNGVAFMAPDSEDIRILRNKHDETVQQLQGSAFSRQIYQATMKLLDEYRNPKDK